MEITEVRIKLMDDSGERLKAFCSITFDDCFVVRDLKIIEGANGPFVAMPSRKLTSHCPKCKTKNHLRAQHCNQCGASLPSDRVPLDSDGRAKLYADIAHPINSACREMIQNHVIDEYYEEIERSKQPGYVSRYEDFDDDYGSDHRAGATSSSRGSGTRFDSAHQKQAPHEPSAGQSPGVRSASRPGAPAPKGHPSKSPRDSQDSFGSGIFPDS